jgi:single-stranded-DNA-specific exonuclease
MLDSSSNDYEQHKILKERGYDIIVLDHHEAPHHSEDAIVVNNQLSKNYPNKNLSGVGVVFKFFEYWEEQQQYKENKIYDYIDLVALGLISDVMQMTTLENRFICDYGLSNIKNTFFRELIKKQCYSLFGIRDADFTDEYYTNGSMTQIKTAFYIYSFISNCIYNYTVSVKEHLRTINILLVKRDMSPNHCLIS